LQFAPAVTQRGCVNFSSRCSNSGSIQIQLEHFTKREGGSVTNNESGVECMGTYVYDARNVALGDGG